MYHLTRQNRPMVDFDPTNVNHRLLYQEFLQTNSWSHSPIRFDMPEQYLDLPYYINLRLVAHYMGQDKKMKKAVDIITA